MKEIDIDEEWLESYENLSIRKGDHEKLLK
jgi:hypothetical protein